MGKALGAVAGAAFLLWIAGLRPIDPGEIGWLMRYDWPVHFFGWHFFRQESWHVPPGLIDGFYAPVGTAIGFTDSIPLMAFALRPFEAWLPDTFQYIGPWLLICFTLQGAFAAALMARWTPNVAAQALAGALTVLLPTLLARIGHPSLCAHWLLLWALIIATREGASRHRLPEWIAIGLIAGLVHPYLAVMSLGILTGVAVTNRGAHVVMRARALVAAVAATLAGWWASGLFSVSGAESMATEGLGYYSMNLLALITSTGWSAVLPEIPRATGGQQFEGFQYLGLGVLVAIVVATVARVRGGRGHGTAASTHGFGPWVIAATVLMAIFALSPVVTAGGSVVIDMSGPWTSRLAVFRATGRFAWPLVYVIVGTTLYVLTRRLSARALVAVLALVVCIQAADLHAVHQERRRSAHDPAFFAWANPMTSAVWERVLPVYDHLVLYPPPQCGTSPMPYEPAAWQAGLHGLTINAGGVARPDEAARLRYCHDLGDQMQAGQIDAGTFYIVAASEVGAIRAAAGDRLVCGVIDGINACVSSSSYEGWRDLAVFQ
ncbi:MAG: hypothetical protein IT178_05940 [Acidobacteria bacterium]|nr:hypothetical protein [Acidobacteriota bacterium]